MREILRELTTSDPEHPDVWLSTEDGWSISINEDRRAVFENVEDTEGTPRHMLGVDDDGAMHLWSLLIAGDLAALERLDWQAGYGNPPLTPAQLHAIEENTMRGYREFYDALGAERPGTRCQRADCERGTVQYSVFCRPHHFESIYKMPSPFNH
jgi:hypothetical protein